MAATAMTPVANEAPMAVGQTSPVQVTAGTNSAAIDVSGYFSDAEGDTLTYSAMSDMEMYATADIPTGSSMLTITGVAAGTATVTVTATDADGSGMSATQDIAVTVVAAPVELGMPMITRTNPVGNGIVLVSWDAVAGATGYSLIAANLSDPSAPTRTAPASAAAVSGQIQGLTIGDEYLIFVGAFNNELEFELSDYVRVVAE